jgi:hypothetical protein
MICHRETLLEVLRSTPVERFDKPKVTAAAPAEGVSDGTDAAGDATATAETGEEENTSMATAEVAVADADAGAEAKTAEEGGKVEGVEEDEGAEEGAEPEVQVTVADMERAYYSEEVIAFLKVNGLYSGHEDAQNSDALMTPRQWVSVGGLVWQHRAFCVSTFYLR